MRTVPQVPGRPAALVTASDACRAAPMDGLVPWRASIRRSTRVVGHGIARQVAGLAERSTALDPLIDHDDPGLVARLTSWPVGDNSWRPHLTSPLDAHAGDHATALSAWGMVAPARMPAVRRIREMLRPAHQDARVVAWPPPDH